MLLTGTVYSFAQQYAHVSWQLLMESVCSCQMAACARAVRRSLPKGRRSPHKLQQFEASTRPASSSIATFINCSTQIIFTSGHKILRSAQKLTRDKRKWEGMLWVEAGVGDETFTKCAKQIRQEASCAAAYVRHCESCARVASVVE